MLTGCVWRNSRGCSPDDPRTSLQPQAGSYTTKLFEGGHDKILKKVAEEAGEVLLASKGGKREEIVYEVADLFFTPSWFWGTTTCLCRISMKNWGVDLGNPVYGQRSSQHSL